MGIRSAHFKKFPLSLEIWDFVSKRATKSAKVDTKKTHLTNIVSPGLCGNVYVKPPYESPSNRTQTMQYSVSLHRSNNIVAALS